ncbi:DNA polymerase III, alpha subunit [Desulfosporosinus sp. I2]|uniref:DUF2680 domain-containing protein n=1 Tax=Desulfosporosinus sp. I2 TaxID=1617025 RepID=UPI0005EDC12E|nr:DUF2680 domain-containing protein [Desulfosporosinus sp. I2]KJR47561.1 DNA polymerase III, alpha subunit [Desulfosporosinus sp. I2]
MKKRLAVGVLSAVLLVGGATAVFAAPDSTQLAELKDLVKQKFSIQKQIVEKEVGLGLRTADQGEAMKKSIDQRQQATEQAIDNGKVFAPGMRSKGMGMRGDATKFTNGQPLTDEQIKTWSDAAEARLTAQVEAMKSYGKLTEEQIKTWSDAAKAQLDVQKEALKSGTFIPGEMGKRGGYGGFRSMTPSTNTQ